MCLRIMKKCISGEENIIIERGKPIGVIEINRYQKVWSSWTVAAPLPMSWQIVHEMAF